MICYFRSFLLVTRAVQKPLLNDRFTSKFLSWRLYTDPPQTLETLPSPFIMIFKKLAQISTSRDCKILLYERVQKLPQKLG